jgi:membrane-bound lytic murein transglycosylase MltF
MTMDEVNALQAIRSHRNRAQWCRERAAKSDRKNEWLIAASLAYQEAHYWVCRIREARAHEAAVSAYLEWVEGLSDVET